MNNFEIENHMFYGVMEQHEIYMALLLYLQQHICQRIMVKWHNRKSTKCHG